MTAGSPVAKVSFRPSIRLPTSPDLSTGNLFHFLRNCATSALLRPYTHTHTHTSSVGLSLSGMMSNTVFGPPPCGKLILVNCSVTLRLPHYATPLPPSLSLLTSTPKADLMRRVTSFPRGRFPSHVRTPANIRQSAATTASQPANRNVIWNS